MTGSSNRGQKWVTAGANISSSLRDKRMPTTAQRLKFGDFELDERSGELWMNGGSVLLPNQPFRILVVLNRQRGMLVTRDELRSELWPEDTFVDFEHSLNARREAASRGDWRLSGCSTFYRDDSS